MDTGGHPYSISMDSLGGGGGGRVCDALQHHKSTVRARASVCVCESEYIIHQRPCKAAIESGITLWLMGGPSTSILKVGLAHLESFISAVACLRDMLLQDYCYIIIIIRLNTI